MEIRGFTIKYTKNKARRKRNEEKSLQKRISELTVQTENNRNKYLMRKIPL